MSTNDSTSFKTKSQSYYVYLIQGEKSKLTKIGISDNPEIRLKQLQRYNTETLTLCSTLECNGKAEARQTEKELHEFFASHRVRGEWFKLTPNQILSKVSSTPRNEPESDSFADWFRFNIPYLCMMLVAFSSAVIIVAGMVIMAVSPGALSDPNANQNALGVFWLVYIASMVTFFSIAWAVSRGR
jgi:hypothetical protein